MTFTSDERLCTVKSPLGDDVLLLNRMTGHEALSTLFRFECEFLSEKNDIDFHAIIGQSVTLEVQLRDGKMRYFNGIVARFSQSASQGRYTAYSAEIMPWMWFLTRTSDCRIFQDKSVPEIIESVFREYGFTDFELPTSSFPPKHYCVQYRETDFNFVSRLMEEAGIGYFFKHSDKSHVCTMFSKPADNPSCRDQATAIYARTAVGGASVGDIENWDIEREFPSGAYTLTDYDPTDPSTDLEATSQSTINVGGNDRFEIYDHPGEHQTLSEGADVTRVRMEAEEAASIVARATTSCAAFSPGYRFKLEGHYRADYNDTYLIREVTHTITQDVGETAGEGSSYSNSIACLPHSIPYRPLQTTPKPIISGVQTATVVGAGGEEIDVDEYGRIVVQFHWDREGKKDENSSCRIRVAQNWAGKNWGAIFNPRIGQEVIVDFLEGDPDRPIVVGRVYNAEQKVPYDLPANKTQSGLKSRSSKEGSPENFNEIRFEDKKGEELLYLQAEKNRKTLVKNDENKEVRNDETELVGRDHQKTIKRDQRIVVEKDRTDQVRGDEDRTVGGNRARVVEGNEVISVSKNQELNVEKDRTLVIGVNQNTEVGKDFGVTVAGNHGVDVTKDHSLSAKTICLEANDQITLETGSARIVMKKNGDITIEGKKIQVKGSGDVIIKGSKIKEN